MTHTYRNSNTGDVYTLADRDSRLESLKNWELVEDAEVPQAAKDALDRAAAERASIAAAAGHRLDRTKGLAEGAVNEATARETGVADGDSPVATLVNAQGENPGSPGNILDKDNRPGVSAIQIGENPEEHPKTYAELKAKADHDEEHPPTDGVLARAKADHRSGAVQIGPESDDHPRSAKAAKAQADYDIEHPPPGGVLSRTHGFEQGKPKPTKKTKGQAADDDDAETPAPSSGPTVDAPADAAPAAGTVHAKK